MRCLFEPLWIIIDTFIYKTLYDTVMSSIENGKMRRKPIWKSLIEFAIKRHIDDDNSFFSTTDFHKHINHSYYSRISEHQMLSRSHSQIKQWLTNLGVHSNFISKYKKEGINTKRGENAIFYHYWRGASYEFFVNILNKTCKAYRTDYQKLLNLIVKRKLLTKDKGVPLSSFGKHLNEDKFIEYILKNHRGAHLPTKKELIKYMKDFIAISFLKNCDELTLKDRS